MEVTVNNITTTVEIEAGYDLFEVIISDLSDENIEKYAIEAAQSAADALASANLAEGYKIQTGLDRAATGSDRIQTGLDAEQTGLDRIATGQDRLATAADRVQTGLDRIQTGLDAQATEADKVQTGLDRTATGEDRTQTGLDKIATGADRIQTGLDATATAADRVQTGLDRVATGADRAQTGLDRTQTGLDSASAANSALIAQQVGTSTVLLGYTVGPNTAILSSDTILQAFEKTQSQINNFSGGLSLNSPITGYVVGANTALTDTDSILQAFGKTQGQINARVSGTIGTGQVAFGSAANTIGGDSSLIWDNVNKRLRINQLTDAGFRLDVNGTARVAASLEITNTGGITFGGGASVLSYLGNNLNIGNSATWTTIRIFAGGVEKFSHGLTTTTIGNTTINLSTAIVQLSGVNVLTYVGTDLRIGSVTAFFNSLSMYVAGSERARITSTGNVLIGTITDVTSAILNVDSTTKGFLPPRMTLTQRNAISTPATGLLVYNTTDNRISLYNGTAWVNLATV